MFKKIADRFNQALIRRRRRFQKRFPFLKHYHPALVFVFIISLIMTMRFVVLPFFIAQSIMIRSYLETNYGTLPSYSVEVGMIAILIVTIMIIRRVIIAYKKSKPIKGERMQAMIYENYGAPDVFHSQEVAKPKAGHDELLIKMKATAVTAGDINMRGFTYVPEGMKLLARMMFGLKQPKKQIIGNVFSGVIESMGAGVKGFEVGDEVFGMDSSGLGSYAEYRVVPYDKAVIKKPKRLSHQEAAAIPFGTMTAKFFLDKAKVEAGDHLLIIGASGSVGSACVQIAKSRGAEVTAVCGTHGVEFVKSLGADRVIDYTQEDYHDNETKYDMIVNLVVSQGDYELHKEQLREDGKYVAIAGGVKDMLRSVGSMFSRQKIFSGVATETKEILNSIVDLVDSKAIKPSIDQEVYTLNELVKAHQRAESKDKLGNVVVKISE
jgi:NADPH:quinone reductase-like Zn-dependent oxidoreductase